MMVRNKLLYLTIFLIFSSETAYASSSMLNMQVVCRVTRGTNIVTVAQNPTMSRIPAAGTAENDIQNLIGTYNVSCPKGSQISVIYTLSEYKIIEGRACKIEKPDKSSLEIYQDASCEIPVKHQSSESYSFHNDKQSVKKSLYCDLKSLKNKKDCYYEVDVTINY